MCCTLESTLESTLSSEELLLEQARTLDSLRRSIDKNMYTCGVFLDFFKALDTVIHSILLKKKKKGTVWDKRGASSTFHQLLNK